MGYKTARYRDRGFTLLEMLIVLLIVGLIAALAIPRMRTPQQPSPLTAFLKQERAQAGASGHAIEIVIIGGVLVSSSGAQFPLDTDIKILQPPPAPLSHPERRLTTFYPDGTMTATSFILASETMQQTFSLSPFSDRIDVAVAPLNPHLMSN